jgi:hypothetical protein
MEWDGTGRRLNRAEIYATARQGIAATSLVNISGYPFLLLCFQDMVAAISIVTTRTLRQTKELPRLVRPRTTKSMTSHEQ